MKAEIQVPLSRHFTLNPANAVLPPSTSNLTAGTPATAVLCRRISAASEVLLLRNLPLPLAVFPSISRSFRQSRTLSHNITFQNRCSSSPSFSHHSRSRTIFVNLAVVASVTSVRVQHQNSFHGIQVMRDERVIMIWNEDKETYVAVLRSLVMLNVVAEVLRS